MATPTFSALRIANMGIVRLQDDPITSFTDGSKAATLADAVFDQALEVTTKDYDANFATARSLITVDPTAPDFEYDYRYALPSDCLKVRQIMNPDNQTAPWTGTWEVENRYILINTDGSALPVKYTRTVTRAEIDITSQLDPHFALCISLQVAAMIARGLTGSAQSERNMFSLYQNALITAAAVNAGESRAAWQDDGSTWVDVN